MNEEHDPFLWHEAMDRSHMIAVHLLEALDYHPVITGNKKLRRLYEKAGAAIEALYWAIGAAKP